MGGILADIMGLGKTLTMISAIVASLDEAANFAAAADREDNSQMELPQGHKSRATLVVVTSIRMSHVFLTVTSSAATKHRILTTCSSRRLTELIDVWIRELSR